MKKKIRLLLFIFLAFPASSNYRLEGYSFGGGGSNNSGSGDYRMQGRLGEITDDMLRGANYDLGAGLAFQRQSGVPKEAALENLGNWYNKLKLTLNNTSQGADIFSTAMILDYFNRTDGAIGDSWPALSGYSYNWYILSNRAKVFDGNNKTGGNYWNVSQYGPDSQVFLTIGATPTATGTYVGLELRLSNPGGDRTGYRLDWTKGGLMRYIRIDGQATFVEIGETMVDIYMEEGYRFGLTVSGNKLQAYRDTGDGFVALGDGVTDSTYSNSGYLGLFAYSDVPTATLAVDDFGGGEYTEGTPFPSDTRFAIAISDDDFVTTKFVKYIDKTVGTSLTQTDYETYANWGGVDGFEIVGLDIGTSYSVKVKSMQGSFTESNWGPTNGSSTGMPSLTFDIDTAESDIESDAPYTIPLGDLLPGVSVGTSKVWVDIGSNAASGVSVYVYGLNGGLLSASSGSNIGATTADLDLVTEGFGIQGSTLTGTGLSFMSPFNLGGNSVGKLDTSIQTIIGSTAPVTGGRASILVKAKVSDVTTSASDYSETLTMVASGNY